MNTRQWLVLSAALAVLSLSSGCASTGAATGGATPSAYGNFLVLGLADSYSNRAYFEREVASRLRAQGAAATPYYEAAGGNTPTDRDSVRAVLASGSYDALIVTRILDRDADIELKQGSHSAKVSRRDDRPIDFFRYDYEELDEPPTLDVSARVAIAGELYEPGTESMVWSTEIRSGNADNAGQLIEETAAELVNRIRRERLIAR